VLTGQTGPQSIGRVPDALANDRFKQAWDEMARPWNVNHQLSIPLQAGGGDHNTYLIQRPDRDFTDQELELAKLLQPVLTGLAFQLAISQPHGDAAMDGSVQELTSREMAILTLLSRGLTAEALARRLSISPRTAEKHLEHIYRKLDVCDRLMAVQKGCDFGLLKPFTAGDSKAQGAAREHTEA
jgi:DNA-binding CsgD family transcriptional regulator